MDRYYSVCGDEWEDFESAIQRVCEDMESGDTFSLAEGDAVQVPISKFVCAYRMLEEIAENAADNYGEYAEDFATDIDAGKEAVKELQLALEMLVCGWAKKHNREPALFDVKNIVWHEWKIVDADDYEVECVQP